IEAFAETINGTFTNATFPNATFPDVARHYFDIVAAGVDDIIHEFNTTIAPAPTISSTTVAHHHRSKRMIFSEQDFLSRIRRLLIGEHVVAGETMVPELLKFLRGFSAMRNEFTLMMQRAVEAGPDATALANQLRQPQGMANYLQEYDQKAFELIWNSDYQALGKLAFKVNVLKFINTHAPAYHADLMNALEAMVRELMQDLEQISLGSANMEDFAFLAGTTEFAYVWNPLQLMMRDMKLDGGVCLSDTVALTVASHLGTSVVDAVKALANAVFLGTGYAQLPHLVRVMLQELAAKGDISSPRSLWRSLGLKEDSHYLSKIGRKILTFSNKSEAGKQFLSIREMLADMVAAFNAKANQLPAGEDVTVRFSICPKPKHMIFSEIQRVNNQLSLTTCDTSGNFLRTSGDSMDQLVAKAMTMLQRLAQQYGLGLTQPAQIVDGKGIGHIYQPTDAEVTEWADMAPIPTSALKVGQILTHPATELAALDKVATKALAKQYVEKVTSADGLKKLKLSQKLTE
ncbi:hypothetical protein, partial [Endozoicomonas sp. YOMI1]|uniref:hypothetical protein n=1 Tax=Endozoicomonas sp. YOMI1 TaxID=2828739 RepID=UPI002148DA3D